MGASTVLIILCAIVGAAVLGFWAYRRSLAPTAARGPQTETRNQAPQWGVRIHAPAREHACPHARELLEKEFPLEAKPPLPLPDCPFPDQCACSYVKLFDRRGEPRREGQERRQKGARFEAGKSPRRSGQDRRKNRLDWF